jgi:hypothetical protein
VLRSAYPLYRCQYLVSNLFILALQIEQRDGIEFLDRRAG